MITIQENKNGRRILIFDSLFDLDSNDNFPGSMFDAVIILPPSPREAKAILSEINPVTSNKCCFKPIFVSKDMENELDDYAELIDGYAYDINDDSVLMRTEDIILHNRELGLQEPTERLSSANLFFVRLCRYLISRRRNRLTPVPQEGAGMGYVIPIFDLFRQLGKYRLDEYIVFLQSMQEKGYFSTVSFVNKIHLCPQCLHSHLLYIECCPQCGSSAIQSEEVIHHFRCANITPEHTYNFGGQLRCPKCHRILRHIGVDYDRPATVYTCSNCDENFLQPRMKALCTNCRKETDVVSLVPHDITVFEITEDGQRALISPNVGFTVYTDFYDNYLEYERFSNRLRLFAGQRKLEGSDDLDLYVTRLWVMGTDGATAMMRTDFIAFICDTFPNRKISSANNMIYIKELEYDRKDLTGRGEYIDRLRDALQELATRLEPGEKISYVRSDFQGNEPGELDAYLNELTYISDEPEGTFEYREKPKAETPAFTISGTPLEESRPFEVEASDGSAFEINLDGSSAPASDAETSDTAAETSDTEK